MDQSKSNEGAHPKPASDIVLPKRSFSVEFFVGIFTLVCVAAGGYLAVGLGDLQIGQSDKYLVYAEFDNISGLKHGASVEIAGVPIGEVSAITLKDPLAIVTLRITRSVQLKDDDIAAIRTKGIIGDRYVKISRGASSKMIPELGTLTETESVVDIEDIIGKIVHSLTSDKDDEGKDEGKGEGKKE
jgi:phospholipid/cholesterol/gamma-HCH transport system substrate-binding protein